jgi:hypothetical protein
MAAPSSEPDSTKVPEPVLEWTTEQDACLVKLKSENMTWKAISTAMDKPVHELKKRWGTVRPTTDAHDKSPGDSADSAKNNAEKAGGVSGESDKVNYERHVSFSEHSSTPGKVCSICPLCYTSKLYPNDPRR